MRGLHERETVDRSTGSHCLSVGRSRSVGFDRQTEKPAFNQRSLYRLLTVFAGWSEAETVVDGHTPQTYCVFV